MRKINFDIWWESCVDENVRSDSKSTAMAAWYWQEQHIAALEKAVAAANHDNNCAYWNWDWQYAWHETDCTCGYLKEQSDE